MPDPKPSKINLSHLETLWVAALLFVALMFNTCGGWSQAERIANSLSDGCECVKSQKAERNLEEGSDSP